VAKRAVVSLEGREHDAALARLVAVLKEERGHEASLPLPVHADIGRIP
jgi:hypothetical protein